MPVLKTQCPECDAKLRLDVDGAGDHAAECPKCGHEFTAALDDETPEQTTKAKKTKTSARDTTKKPSKGSKDTQPAKKTKAARRRDDDDEDDDDDAPRKKRKTDDETETGNTKLIIAGVVAAVLLLGGVGGIIYAVTAKKKTDPPAEVVQQPAAAPTPPTPTPPPPNTNPATGTNPLPQPQPETNPNPEPGTNPPPGPTFGPGGAKPPGPAPVPPKPEDAEIELATALPPPPKLRNSGSFVPNGKPIVRPPTVPPLAPDEDPFVRALSFRPEAALPTLPKLPPPAQRPNLALDAGGHTGFVKSVFFTVKGDRIITIGEDKMVRICDVASGDTVRTIRLPAGPGDEGALLAGALSPNGKLLAVGGKPIKSAAPGTVPVFVLNLETGTLVTTLKARGSQIDALDFSRTGNELAVGSVVVTADDKLDAGIAQLFRVKDGQLLGIDDHAHHGGFQEIRYHPDPKKKTVATLGRDSTVKVWDFINPKNTFTVKIGGAVRPTCLDWSSDGHTLAIGGRSGQVILATSDGQLIRTYKPRTYNGAVLQIFRLRYAPGDRELVACGVGGRGWAGVIDAETGDFKIDCTAHSNTVMSVNVSPDGTKAVSNGGNQNETIVWDTATGKEVRKFVAGGSGVWAVGWSKDGKSLAWGTEPPLAKNRSSVGKLEGTFRLDEFGVGDEPDPAKYAQAVEADDTVSFKQTGPTEFVLAMDGRPPRLVGLPNNERVFSVSVLPRGNALIVGGAKSLYLVNPATLTIMKEFVGHSGNILAVAPSPDGRYFVSGASDQTMRIWRRDQEDPIMSIYVSGREWIAWTPQGYYACSPQGEALIAWQINGSALKIPQVHPAARFRPSMYQPAILKYLIPAGGDLPRALAMAQKFDQALVQTTSVADVLPPEVTLDGFGEGDLKVETNALTVKASATSTKHPITAMRLLVDGRPFQGTAGVKKFDAVKAGAEATATWEVPLVPGTHTFAVIADSPVSKGMSKVGIVVKPGEPPKPNLYMLAIGISDYPGHLKLHYCDSDARMLEQAFKEHSKNVFAKIETRVLTNKEASRKGVLEGLDWLKSKMTPQDVGIVSFSGHGMRDPFGRFYLVTADVSENDPEHTCLPGDVFKDRLDNMPGRLVAILDACHSGTVAEKAPPPARADTLVRDLSAEDSGVMVMCASLGREYASESKLTKAGFYTFGLVEGLAGYADIDGDGTVYINELNLYATARVRQLSHGRQNPSLGRPATVRPFPISKPDNPPKP